LMKLFLTADDKNGLGFNRRRQSRDANIIADMLSVIGGEKLYLSAYSASLFGEAENLEITENPLQNAPKDAFCFVEAQNVSLDGVEILYLYRFGRSYPSDVKLPPLTGMEKVQTREFAGSSHDKITLEVYRR